MDILKSVRIKKNAREWILHSNKIYHPVFFDKSIKCILFVIHICIDQDALYAFVKIKPLVHATGNYKLKFGMSICRLNRRKKFVSHFTFFNK